MESLHIQTVSLDELLRFGTSLKVGTKQGEKGTHFFGVLSLPLQGKLARFESLTCFETRFEHEALV